MTMRLNRGDTYVGVARRFGANLVEARKRAGISQEELGFRAGLHRTQIGSLERGAGVPRIDTLVKLAAALDSPLEGPLLEGIRWRPALSSPGGFDVTSAEVKPGGVEDA
jgi:transcriptional regulator with XRE-family HTH domain